MNLGIFTLISALIYCCLTQFRINLITSLYNLFRLLTNQSANDLTLLRVLSKVRPLLTRSSLVLLTFVWLQSASVLTKAFTGLLLETYFNVRSETLINSLEDLHERTDLEIMSPSGSGRTTRFLKRISNLSGYEKMIKDIQIRIEKFENETKPYSQSYAQSIKVINKVIKGKAVIICSSIHAKNYLKDFEMLSDRFSESRNKYGYSFTFHIINKKHSLRFLMKFL